MADRSARLAGALTREHGVGRGDVVMTLIGNRPEWVLTMVACFRIGAVALACNEQLRAHDLALRLEAARPRVIVADERDLGELTAAGPACPVITIPDETLFDGRAGAGRRARAARPVPDHVHQRHHRRAGRGGPRSALPARPAPAGRALAGRAARRPGVVHGGHAAGRSRPATRSSRRGCAAPPRCCTITGSTRRSASSCSPPSGSTSCAWPRPSTA